MCARKFSYFRGGGPHIYQNASLKGCAFQFLIWGFLTLLTLLLLLCYDLYCSHHLTSFTFGSASHAGRMLSTLGAPAASLATMRTGGAFLLKSK